MLSHKTSGFWAFDGLRMGPALNPLDRLQLFLVRFGVARVSGNSNLVSDFLLRLLILLRNLLYFFHQIIRYITFYIVLSFIKRKLLDDFYFFLFG